VIAEVAVSGMYCYHQFMTSRIEKVGKIGRPSVDSEQITMRLPREIILALDDYRRGLNELPIRSEAIRLLLKEQLAKLGYLPTPSVQEDQSAALPDRALST
jgi:hypothetical protein